MDWIPPKDKLRAYLYSFRKKRAFRKMDGLIYPDLTLTGGDCITIGKNSIIGKHVILSVWKKSARLAGFNNPSLVIGNGVDIGEYNHITAINRIEIGDGVLTGRWVTISDNNHGDTSYSTLQLRPIKRPVISSGPIIIEENVWIGDKATILGNVRIGEGSVIGSNAVVTKDVPPYSVVAGVPAQIIKNVHPH